MQKDRPWLGHHNWIVVPAAAYPPQTAPAWSRVEVLICLVLAGLVWTVFGQTRHHDFVNYDDDSYVYENGVVKRGLDWNNVIWAFTHRHSHNWHPLTTLSHMLDCQIYGPDAGGHHLTNVLLHAATAVLLFVVLRNLTGARWRSTLVAAVFAIHPLRVESVAWVAERKDVLSGFFFVLTVAAYARYARRLPAAGGSGIFSFLRVPAYWLALGLYGLGLMSKPMLVTVPFVLLLLDYWPLNRISNKPFSFAALKPLWLEKIPFLLLSAGGCAVTLWAQEEAVQWGRLIGRAARLENAIVSYAVYVKQMFWPVHLAVFYPHHKNHLEFWQVGAALLVLMVISAAVFIWRRERPWLLVGWLWYAGMLVPVIGLVQVGMQAHADRYTYLPSIGLSIMTIWGVVELGSRWRYGWAVLSTPAVAALGGLLIGARIQTGYWQNSQTLWTRELACADESSVLHGNLGAALVAVGKFPEGVDHLQRALQIDPDFSEAHFNLGIALAAQGKLDEAVAHYLRSLQLDPNCAPAHYWLGVALGPQGKLDEAIGHFQQALKLGLDTAELHNNWGTALAQQGRRAEAVAQFRRALALAPDYAKAWGNLGHALAEQGKADAARPCYQRALQLAQQQGNPSLAESLRAQLAELPPAGSAAKAGIANP